MAKKLIGANEPSVEQMFKDRMLREKRWPEWEQAKLDAKSACTLPQETVTEKIARGKAITADAMKRCGFISRDHEKATYRAFNSFTERQEVARVTGTQSRTFDMALKELPIKADPQIENDWVMAHPAIARKSRNEDQSKRVIITGDDILHADHGPCPSRAAANKLQYWANNPQKAFEALTMPMKKGDGGEGGRDGDVVEDVELAEVERLLKAVTNG